LDTTTGPDGADNEPTATGANTTADGFTAIDRTTAPTRNRDDPDEPSRVVTRNSTDDTPRLAGFTDTATEHEPPGASTTPTLQPPEDPATTENPPEDPTNCVDAGVFFFRFAGTATANPKPDNVNRADPSLDTVTT
jgi:hypothetical protein